VQLFGNAREARGSQARAGERQYAKRFPRFARWLGSRSPEGKALAAQVRSYRFYRFVPSKVKILDEATFGGAVFVEARVRKTRAP